jgi:phage terminase small subunit
MAGRRPIPTRLKLLRGNPGKRQLNRDEPTPAAEAPSCPSHLGKTARREWRRISRELLKLGLLTKPDRAALAGYCAAFGDWVDTEAEWRVQGRKFLVLVMTAAGGRDEAIAIYRDYPRSAEADAQLRDRIWLHASVPLACHRSGATKWRR